MKKMIREKTRVRKKNKFRQLRENNNITFKALNQKIESLDKEDVDFIRHLVNATSNYLNQNKIYNEISASKLYVYCKDPRKNVAKFADLVAAEFNNIFVPVYIVTDSDKEAEKPLTRISFIPNENTTKADTKEKLTSYQKSIIRDMAEADYEIGHPMSEEDALGWFSSGEEEDIPVELAKEAADYYFEAFDQIREEDNSDWDKDDENLNESKISNMSCYGAKVGSNIVVTIDEDNYKNFIVGNSVKVIYDGKDHIRKVRDFPEDIGITVKGYPVYYSDFNFVKSEDYDDWLNNFDGQNFDDWYQFDRKSIKKESKMNKAKKSLRESLSSEEVYDKWLHGGSDEVNHNEDDMNSMDKVFKPASEDIEAYKGDPYTKEELENFKTKKFFYKKVFASTTTNINVASDYMTRAFDLLVDYPDMDLVPIMFYITVKKGTPVAFAKTDQEVTIGRNTKWTLSNFREEYDSIYEEYYYAFDVVIEKADLKESRKLNENDSFFDALSDGDDWSIDRVLNKNFGITVPSGFDIVDKDGSWKTYEFEVIKHYPDSDAKALQGQVQVSYKDKKAYLNFYVANDDNGPVTDSFINIGSTVYQFGQEADKAFAAAKRKYSESKKSSRKTKKVNESEGPERDYMDEFKYLGKDPGNFIAETKDLRDDAAGYDDNADFVNFADDLDAWLDEADEQGFNDETIDWLWDIVENYDTTDAHSAAMALKSLICGRYEGSHMKHFFEDKARFVDKAFTAMLGANWQDEYGNDVNGYDVDAVKKFVNSSAVNKYKINWQEPADALYNDILDAYDDYLDKGGSLSQRAKATKEDPRKMFENAPLVVAVAHSGDEIDEGIDLVILDSLENDTFIFAAPLSWEACKWIDSFKCGGQGAKWCLGYEQDDSYWNDYTDNGNLFILAFNKKEFAKPSGEPDRLKYMIQLSQTNETQVWKQSDDPKGTIKGGAAKKLFGHSWNELATAVVEAVGCDDNVYTMSPEWSYWGDQYDEVMNAGGEAKYYDKDEDIVQINMSELFGQPAEELTKATDGLEEVKIVFDGDTTQGIGAANGIINVAAPSSGFTMLESILSAIACPRVIVMNLYNAKVQLSKDIGQVKELDFYECGISNLLLTKDFLDKYKDMLAMKELDYISVKNIMYVDATMKEAAKYQASKMMKDIGLSSKPAIWDSKNCKVIDLESQALFGVVRESRQKRNVRRLVEDITGQAYRVAKRKHDDTGAVRRATGDPYIVHPAGVAKIVKAFGGTDDQVAAAFLHDTVEDAGATIDDIAEKFGQNVADIVNDVTTDPYERRRLGKEEYINQELQTISDDALMVKLADMYYNINDHADKNQHDRIVRNVSTLLNSDRGEELDNRCLDLIAAILEAA